MTASLTKLNLVVAACNNGGIGFDGQIPWRIKQDLAFFKKITCTTMTNKSDSKSGNVNRQNVVIMGRKTWFSIPEKMRPLPGRINIILSRSLETVPAGAHLARSLDDAVSNVTAGPLAAQAESIFIIGGSAVYREAMSSNYPCRLYLTRVLRDFQCDTFLPPIDNSVFHKITVLDIPSETLTENGIDFKFEVYEKA